MIKVDTIRLHPNSAVLLSEYYSDDGNGLSRGNSSIHSRKQINSTKLSSQSRKKMTRAITYMAHISPDKKIHNPKFNSTFKFRLSFITLTLASRQQHDDTVLKKELLHPFLDWLIKVYKINFYVWKAERQKNQNLHFHIIVDKYIPYQIINNKWNRYQDKLHYVRNYWTKDHSNKPFPKTQRDYFAVNGTDIHSTRKVKDLAKYMSKYMIKNDTSNRIREKRNIKHLPKNYDKQTPRYTENSKIYLKNFKGVGRIWGCSYNLSNLKGAYDTLNIAILDELEVLQNHKDVYQKNEAYFKYISFDNKLLDQLKLFHLKNLLNNYLTSQFGLLKEPT